MDNFKFVMPAIIEKSEEGDWKISGLASTEAKDRQNEILCQKGMDLTPIEEKRGYFNFEHRNDPENLIGLIDGYNKSNEGLYVHGRLFKNSSRAKAVYDIMSSLGETDKGRIGMSVEGQILERDKTNPTVIKKCQIKNVALTFNPVNTGTHAELIKSMSTAEKLDFDTSEKQIVDIKEEPIFTATQVIQILTKALSSTGSIETKAPNKLTGGDAMQTSNMTTPKKKKKDSEKIEEEIEEVPKKLKSMSKSLFKSNLLNILDKLQILYPENSRVEIWEVVKERLKTKYSDISE